MRATPALKHCSRQSSSQHAARRCELPSRLDPSLVHDGFELAEAADRSASPAVARERSVDCHWQRAHAEGRGWTLWSAVALPCPVRSSYPRPNLYPRRMSALCGSPDPRIHPTRAEGNPSLQRPPCPFLRPHALLPDRRDPDDRIPPNTRQIHGSHTRIQHRVACGGASRVHLVGIGAAGQG